MCRSWLFEFIVSVGSVSPLRVAEHIRKDALDQLRINSINIIALVKQLNAIHLRREKM